MMDGAKGLLRLVTAAVLVSAPVVARGEEPAPPGPPPASAPGVVAPGTSAPATTPPAPAAAPATPAAPVPPAGGSSRTGKISGTVTDVMRHALAGLLVKLESRGDPGTLRVTSTDPKGMYHFKDLPPGVYDVRVEADGFGPGSKERIDVRPPFQNIVDVSLARAAAGDAPAATAVAAAPEEAGAEPVVVRGRFVDTEGRPELEVSVLLVGQGGRLYQAFSAADGTFVIDGVVPGRYRMLVRSTGHMPIDLKSVEVRRADGLKLSLALVDFPLDTRPHASAPPEIPRPLPPTAIAAPAAPPAARPPAPPPGAPSQDGEPAGS